MIPKMLTVGTLFSATLVILLSLLFNKYSPDNDLLKLRLEHVLNGLIDVENKQNNKSELPKVAVGYGACNDLLVEGKNFLVYENSLKSFHCDDINSIEQLKKSFGYFFKHGAAAERYMSNSTLFDELVAAASALEHSRFSLGGNAPMMAQRMSQEGCDVLLAATLTPRLRNSLLSDLKVVGGEADRDDVHLILEYKAGDTWGPFKSPRANRFIVHNDNNNPLISSLEEFQQNLMSFNADLLVVSGLQMMDNYPFKKGERRKRLLAIREQMVSQINTKVHFEMASFVETELLENLVDLILPHANSLGMNEQELANLISIYQYGNVSLIADSNPRVATVLDGMRQLLRLVENANQGKPKSRLLTRIHVHTLAYQAILIADTSQWPNSDVAVAKASLTAFRHVCASTKVDVEKARLIMDDSFSVTEELVSGEPDRVVLEPQNPVACWREASLHLCVAPVLVCKVSVQTAGGGDNISAAALAMQL